jgi:iron complex outermembrane receptor protein
MRGKISMSRKLQWAAVQTASCCVLATSAALVAAPAWADAPSPQGETAPAQVPAAEPAAAALPELSEVIVTARRRGENLEKVPVSISALDSESLGKRTIQTEQDLQIAVPGLIVRPTEESNNLSFSIRGQGVDAQSGSRPGVLPYINDIQVNTSTASSFFDLASVQVLKGPQGTLFGRNATGGAVLYTTAKPTNDLSGYATIRGGNLGQAEFQGAISIPIVQDKVLLRVAGDAQDRHGYVNNLYNGTRLGDIETRAIRATLLVRPIDKLENTTVFHYEVDNGTNIGPEIYSAYACGSSNGSIPLASATNCLFSPALDTLVGVPGLWNAYLATHPKVPAGGIVAYLDQQRAQGPYQVQFDNATSHRSHNYYLANTTTYEINSDLQFKNILGLTNASARDNTDLDGTPYGLLEVRDANRNPSASLNNTRQFSEEFQLLGKALDQHLNYIVGVYYGYERDIQLLPVNVADLSPIIPSTLNVVGATLRDYTEAVFTRVLTICPTSRRSTA